MNAWWIGSVAAVALVVLLAPFIRHSRRPPSQGEEAFNWVDTVVKAVSGLWPR